MQPYIFPYIGYFQLIDAVDAFVFYDDVNFIKQGWINRNRILIHDQEHLFTVPLTNQSSFVSINETFLHPKQFPLWREKFIKSISLGYRKAPYFKDVMKLIEEVLYMKGSQIGELAEQSVKSVCAYLNMEREFHRSSRDFSETRELERGERLVAICNKLGAQTYINPKGGMAIYTKDFFSKHGIELGFIDSRPEIPYQQTAGRPYVSSLSMIDVLMQNSPEAVVQRIMNYTII